MQEKIIEKMREIFQIEDAGILLDGEKVQEILGKGKGYLSGHRQKGIGLEYTRLREHNSTIKYRIDHLAYFMLNATSRLSNSVLKNIFIELIDDRFPSKMELSKKEVLSLYSTSRSTYDRAVEEDTLLKGNQHIKGANYSYLPNEVVMNILSLTYTTTA